MQSNAPSHGTTARSTDLELVEELKSQWMAMIDAIDDPLVIVDGDFSIARQNRAYFDHAQGRGNASIRELGGRKCYEVFAGRKAPCTHCRARDASAAGKPVSWNTTELKHEREFEIRAHTTGSGRVVVHYRDVTEIHQMKEELARSDKLAALGKLAGGVAHEINSPLAGILAFAQMALREMDAGDSHLQDMREIEDAARKCKAIVEGLLGFARQDKPSDEKVFDLFASVRSTLRLASPLLKKHGIEAHLFLPDDTQAARAPIRGNEGKLDQVLLNLVTNAIQAMKQGGALEISAEIRDDSERDAEGDETMEGRTAGRKVILQVRDSGEGIDPAIIGRIFDPFFTTKRVGEGTGLGLSITYSILKQHGGDISVQSQPGVGTTFTLVLPLVQEP